MRKDIIFGAAFWFFLCKPLSAHADQTVYFLDQVHRELGRMHTYFNANGFRVDNLPTKCTYVASAPTWNLTIYSIENNCFSQDSLSHWMAHAVRPNAAAQLDLSDDKLASGKPVTFKGLAATEYKIVIPKQSEDERKKRVKSFLTTLVSADYTVANRQPMPSQAGEFLRRFYNMPEAKGIPLHSHALTKTGEHSITLTTKQAKQQAVADNFFALPGGLKRVKNESAVVINAAKLNDLSELMTGQSMRSEKR